MLNFIAIALVLLPLTVFAESKSEQRVVIERKTQTFSAGPQLLFFHYHEIAPPPFKSIESGAIPGFRINYDNEINNHVHFLGHFEGNFATTRYDGGLQDRNGRHLGDYVGTTRNIILESHLGAGFPLIAKGSSLSLMPYAKLGFHSWSRDLQGAYGYNENYLWFVLPIGVRAGYHPTSRLEIGLDTTLKLNLGGTIEFQLSRIGQYNVRGGLGSGIGVKQEVFGTYQFSDSFSLSAILSYEAINIGEGSKVNMGGSTVHEPASHTKIFGTNISTNFTF